jgi:hypothetical protein
VRKYQSTLGIICVVAIAVLITPKVWAVNRVEVSLAGGIAVPHSELRSTRSTESNRGVGGFAALDQFVDPLLSLGMRVGYSGFKHSSYSEVSCRLALNFRPAEKFGPFLHSLVGVHSTKRTELSTISIGYGVGLGLRIPMSKTNRQRFLVESTYYITRDARMFALRFGLAFGSLTSRESEEF